jgi:hypothetical protein
LRWNCSIPLYGRFMTFGKVKVNKFLVNQDLHGDNVLRAQREPWLVIDPKPLVGEREFSIAPIVRSYEFGHSQKATVDRLTDSQMRWDSIVSGRDFGHLPRP